MAQDDIQVGMPRSKVILLGAAGLITLAAAAYVVDGILGIAGPNRTPAEMEVAHQSLLHQTSTALKSMGDLINAKRKHDTGSFQGSTHLGMPDKAARTAAIGSSGAMVVARKQKQGPIPLRGPALPPLNRPLPAPPTPRAAMRTAPSSDTGNEASVVSFASPSADDGTLQLGKVRTDVAHLKTDLATVARKWEAASSTISLRLARQESRVEGLSTRTEVLDLARARLEDWVTEISRTGNGSNCPSLLPPIGSLHAPMTPAT